MGWGLGKLGDKMLVQRNSPKIDDKRQIPFILPKLTSISCGNTQSLFEL